MAALGNPLITGAFGSPVGQESGGPSAQFSSAVVVDGTPLRVAMLGVAAGVVVFSLRKAGFKFNVGVS